MALRGKPANGRLVPGDRELIQILDASMAEASSSDSGLVSPGSVAYNGDSSAEHEDSSSDSDESFDN